MPTKFGTFKDSKGNAKPTISLLKEEGDSFPFFFGIAKAKLIIDNFEDIKKFYEEYKDMASVQEAEKRKIEINKIAKDVVNSNRELLDRLAKEED